MAKYNLTIAMRPWTGGTLIFGGMQLVCNGTTGSNA